MYYQQNYEELRQQEPSLTFLPPSVIERYMNQWIVTSIQGYGRVIAYVLDFNPRNGMVSLLIYPEPFYQQQFIQVHNSDLVGIAPYTGPIPPRPTPPRPPQPRPPHPRPPWSPGPGQQQGGGFWPWFWQGINLFGGQQQR